MTLFKKSLGIGLVSVLLFACSSDDKITNDTTNPEASTEDTFVSFSLKIATNNESVTRSTSSKWTGRDVIESVDVFLINLTKGTVDHESYKLADFNVVNNVLTPKKAIKASSGEDVKAYAIINGVGFEKLNSYTANDLDKFFSSEAYAMTNFTANATTKDGKDVVMMTNAVLPVSMEIQPNVSAEEAVKGSNQINITVQRIAARGVVTHSINSDQDENIVTVLDQNGKIASEVYVTDVSYAIGLNNKELFIVQKGNLTTPASSYNYIPLSHEEWANETNGVRKYFDFSSLQNPVNVAQIGKDGINGILANELTSQFVLPVTHEDGKYRKGNTTYFEITAKFRPVGDFEGNIGYEENAAIYVGKIDGKLYPTEKAVRVANGDYFTLYPNGEMKYYVWLNPDKGVGAAKTSPTLRNTVYHANISKFKQLGFPTNPLDPTKPIDPTNPVKPTDPLETVDTYLSVDIEIIDWDVVSNDIEL